MKIGIASLKRISAGAIFAVAGFVSATSASAAPLFFDDFEGDLTKWFPNANGQIVVDPLNASNHVLSFAAVNTGGDIFSSGSIPLVTGQKYAVSFDFYGVKSTDSGSGGYAGISAGTPGNHGWYAATVPTGYTTLPNALTLQDDAGWQTYTYEFIAPISLSGSPTNAIKLMFEDFAYSGSIAGNAYFDNVSVNAIPIPAALPLFGAGLAGLGLLGWRRKRATPSA